MVDVNELNAVLLDDCPEADECAWKASQHLKQKNCEHDRPFSLPGPKTREIFNDIEGHSYGSVLIDDRPIFPYDNDWSKNGAINIFYKEKQGS